MNGVPHPRRTAGQGRGHNVYPNLEFWEDRPGRNPGTSHVRRDPVSNNFKLHVRSIPSNWNLTIFQNVFSKCGEPKNIYLNPQRGPNTLTWGFVEYENYQEAYNAVRELNNNILLNIQVMFAREKPAEDQVDPVLKFLASEPQEGLMESLVDPRTLVKTVKNDNTLSSEILIEDFHKPVLDAETQKCIEEALFQKILEIYKEVCSDEKKGEGSTAKCDVCEASCSSACSGCLIVFYCSENCQNRDWASHSRNCKGANMGAAEQTVSLSRGGGDNRQTNGFGSFDSERENRSDNRTNRFADKRNNRDNDRGNNRDSDRGYNRDSGRREEQNSTDQQGKKSLFEERKARMAVSRRQCESDGGFQNRFGQNNQRSQNGQETRHAFKPRTNAGQTDEDWGSQNQDKDVKDSSATTPGLDFINKEKAFLQEIEIKKEVISTSAEIKEEIEIKKEVIKTSAEIKEEIEDKNFEVIVPAPAIEAVNVNKTAEEQLLQPGLALEVLIYFAEDRGLFWVQKTKQESKVKALFGKLEDYFRTCSSQFTPVQDGICGIHYEGQWYRCQITSLDPLTVLYIDFGYPETVEANRLFELSSELKSLPPFVFKIKLVDGTPELYLDKGDTDTLNVKLIEKVDNYWLAQIMNDKAISAEVPEAATSNNPPAAVTTPAPAVEVPAEPAQTNQAVLSDTPPPATQQPYPPMLDATRFSTVVVTYCGGTEHKDTYYVGAPTVWETLAEMCSHFKNVIQHCEVLTPKHGTKGLAMFMGEWYRVKVVSLTPKVLAYYIDFGNIELVEPDGLRKCPETHKDIPHLVRKIKLAPGTNEKYFNLPEESEISVKPVSWLADSTIMVEVEGENYAEGTIEGPEDPTVPGTAPPSALGPTSSPSAPTSDAPQPTNATASDLTGSVTQATTAFSGPTAAQVDLIPSKPPCAVDLLQEKWKISFVPSKVDYVKNSLLGQVYSEHIPSTFSFMAENENYQKYLSSQEFDPNYKPNEGEIVGLRLPSGGWERGRVLAQQGLVAFNDNGSVTHSSQLFKLPESFVNIPSMAAVLTLRKEDPDLLSRLVDEDEIIFDVVKVTSNKGRTVVDVTNNASQEGELRTWDYEPLETPDPLAPGESVTISRVIDSNTLLVSPVNDLEIQQAIQIDCRKTSEEFKCPPKEGDYVSFLDKESDGYFRCRIDKIDGDTYSIYAVDNATYHQAKLGDLHPLPSSLRNVPCRISQIELKDVDKVDTTEQAQVYLCHIVEEDKFLTVVFDDSGKATLTVEGEEDTLNNKLKVLLKPQVVPNSEGKLTILSLPELGVPLNKDFEFVVTQTEPLYVQLASPSLKYYKELHDVLQEHCAKDKAPYNPCEGELCLANFEGDWYRCRCLRETNTGVSVLMLVDYGNIFNAPTSDIRRIVPEMLTMPSIATSCKIHGLPDPVSPPLKARLTELLVPDIKHSGIFVAENDGCYEVVIESVKQAIQELQ